MRFRLHYMAFTWRWSDRADPYTADPDYDPCSAANFKKKCSIESQTLMLGDQRTALCARLRSQDTRCYPAPCILIDLQCLLLWFNASCGNSMRAQDFLVECAYRAGLTVI